MRHRILTGLKIYKIILQNSGWLSCHKHVYWLHLMNDGITIIRLNNYSCYRCSFHLIKIHTVFSWMEFICILFHSIHHWIYIIEEKYFKINWKSGSIIEFTDIFIILSHVGKEDLKVNWSRHWAFADPCWPPNWLIWGDCTRVVFKGFANSKFLQLVNQ